MKSQQNPITKPDLVGFPREVPCRKWSPDTVICHPLAVTSRQQSVAMETPGITTSASINTAVLGRYLGGDL